MLVMQTMNERAGHIQIRASELEMLEKHQRKNEAAAPSATPLAESAELQQLTAFPRLRNQGPTSSQSPPADPDQRLRQLVGGRSRACRSAFFPMAAEAALPARTVQGRRAIGVAQHRTPRLLAIDKASLIRFEMASRSCCATSAMMRTVGSFASGRSPSEKRDAAVAQRQQERGVARQPVDLGDDECCSLPRASPAARGLRVEPREHLSAQYVADRF